MAGGGGGANMHATIRLRCRFNSIPMAQFATGRISIWLAAIFLLLGLASSQTTYSWKFVRGPQVPDSRPVFGTRGVAAPENIPGSRHSGFGGSSQSTKSLIVFGGNGRAADGASGAPFGLSVSVAPLTLLARAYFSCPRRSMVI